MKPKPKPKRRAPCATTRRAVRARQKGLCGCRQHCGATLPPDGKGLVHYQHDPALGIRPINDDGTDWIPPQQDPEAMRCEIKACHQLETTGDGTYRSKLKSDRYAIDRMRRHEKPPKPKSAWPEGRKLQGRGFQKGKQSMRGKQWRKKS